MDCTMGCRRKWPLQSKRPSLSSQSASPVGSSFMLHVKTVCDPLLLLLLLLLTPVLVTPFVFHSSHCAEYCTCIISFNSHNSI